MADHTSGFNVATYVTWREELSGLCGLTAEDVLSALRLPIVCKSEVEVQNHFKIMKDNYDGYNFVEMDKVQHVFNTNTCLEYLEVSDRLTTAKELFSSDWLFIDNTLVIN